tara:strand:- start:2114 stop:3883 length:1770 start_codon:yes stop_codon:yes gene_type:complete
MADIKDKLPSPPGEKDSSGGVSHGVMSKSFGLQRKTLARVIGLEKRVDKIESGSGGIDADKFIDINRGIAAVNSNMQAIADTIEADLVAEREQARDEKLESKQELDDIKKGKAEKFLELKREKKILQPMKKITENAKGVFQRLFDGLTSLFGGFILDKGSKMLDAWASGDTERFDEMKNEIIKSLQIVGGILLAINIGSIISALSALVTGITVGVPAILGLLANPVTWVVAAGLGLGWLLTKNAEHRQEKKKQRTDEMVAESIWLDAFKENELGVTGFVQTGPVQLKSNHKWWNFKAVQQERNWKKKWEKERMENEWWLREYGHGHNFEDMSLLTTELKRVIKDIEKLEKKQAKLKNKGKQLTKEDLAKLEWNYKMRKGISDSIQAHNELWPKEGPPKFPTKMAQIEVAVMENRLRREGLSEDKIAERVLKWKKDNPDKWRPEWLQLKEFQTTKPEIRKFVDDKLNLDLQIKLNNEKRNQNLNKGEVKLDTSKIESSDSFDGTGINFNTALNLDFSKDAMKSLNDTKFSEIATSAFSSENKFDFVPFSVDNNLELDGDVTEGNATELFSVITKNNANTYLDLYENIYEK